MELQRRMALRDRFLARPEGAGPEGLQWGLRFGSEAHRLRCLRQLGPSAGLMPLLGALSATPAERRAAAGVLAQRGDPAARAPLWQALRAERSEEGLVLLAVALLRCGEEVGPLRTLLQQFFNRNLETFDGARAPSAAMRLQDPAERLDGWLGEGSYAQLRALRQEALAREYEGRRGYQHILDLAALRHPDDFETLKGLFLSIGRRGAHALHIALGVHGDPRALPLLKEALFATDVDPGRGFTQRRLCAMALGRLGLREGVPLLLRALEYEALDYEGRPGAGLGIQYPVRADILVALGEIGDLSAVPTLLSYLGNIHGSAFGGFYLPAMDALCRLGPGVLPQLMMYIRQVPVVDACNALGVVAALGGDLRSFEADPRQSVAQMARRLLQIRVTR